MDWIHVYLLSLSVLSQAGAQPAPPPPPGFEGGAELSFVGTSGNSDSRSLGGGLSLTFRPDAWTITSKSSLIRSEDSGVVRAQSAVFATQANRNLTQRVGVFGRHEYMRNRFAGINHRNTVGTGLSYAAIKSERQALALEAGVGYANERRLIGPNLSSAIGTAAAAYKVALSDTATFENELGAVTSFNNSRDQRVTNTASLSASLTTTFSLKVRHATRWVRSPVPGFRKTDTIMAVALVATF
jgi:putative salt-induced outer membrane protein